MAEKHTPTPWAANGRYIGTTNHMSAVGECRDMNGNWCDDAKASANASFIVSAVNSHDKLVEALRQMVVNSEADGKSYRDCHKKAVAALASLDQEKPAQLVSEDNDCDDYYVPDESGYSRADEEWFFGMDGKP